MTEIDNYKAVKLHAIFAFKVLVQTRVTTQHSTLKQFMKLLLSYRRETIGSAIVL